jgi:hypothetical protein
MYTHMHVSRETFDTIFGKGKDADIRKRKESISRSVEFRSIGSAGVFCDEKTYDRIRAIRKFAGNQNGTRYALERRSHQFFPESHIREKIQNGL